jgi:hypothetical protein
VNAKRLARLLLLNIESRGRDATGFAFRDSTGDIQVHKKPMKASEFVRRNLCLPKNAHTAILHTRAATQGEPAYNENNHPVQHGAIVGVHNGHISNDFSLFTEMNVLPLAEVDSEAAFAAINYLSNPHPVDALEKLRGWAALAWLHREDQQPDRLFLARAETSPLIVVESMEGSVVFASTEFAALSAMRGVGMEPKAVREIEEGRYMEVVRGHIDNVRSFAVPQRYPSWSSRKANRQWWNDDSDYEVLDEVRMSDGTTWVQGPDYVWREQKPTKTRHLTPVTSDWRDDVDRYLGTAQQRDVSDAKSPMLSATFLKPGTQLTALTGDAHRVMYEDREDNVEQWLRGMHALTDHEWYDAADAMKAFVRQGEPCKTKLNGTEVFGHIYKLPTQFPYGDYILRVSVPRDAARTEFEFAFIARKYDKFTVIDNPVKAKREQEFSVFADAMSTEEVSS